MKSRFTIFVIVFCAVAIYAFKPEIEDFVAYPKPNGSLKILLSLPDSFENKNVTLEGLALSGYEMNSLWESKGALTRIRGNAIWIDLPTDSSLYKKFACYNHKMIRITGTFSKEIKGHLQAYPGGLTKISNIELLSQ